MLLDNVFEPFIKEAPICVMARGVLQRILDPHHIDHLFTQTAQRQYTNELLFSSLVDLMTRVVIGQEPSVHAAYRKLEDQLPVSDQSVYNKLQHVELAVSAALVRDSARRIAPVIRALRASLPPLLPGYRVKFLDGNHLAATEHRLEELRSTWAAPLPGLALAVLDQEHMTVTDVLLSEDGHAQERACWARSIPWSARGRGVGGGPQLLHFGIARGYLGPRRLLRPAPSTATSRVSCWANGDRRAAVRRAGFMSNACGCEAKRGK